MGLSRSKKTIIREISKEIENGFVEEQNLERLEILDKILEEGGSVLPESLKDAYCQVALECTVRRLVCAEGATKSYTEAIKRIWIQRVMSLCESQSRLVTSDLKDCCQILQTAICDRKARESLIEDNTRNKALLSLKRLVSDPLFTGESPSCDTSRVSPEIFEAMPGEGEKEIAHRSRAPKAKADGRETIAEDKLPRSIHAVEQPKGPAKISDAGGSDAEPSVSRVKSIRSPIFNRVLGDLRASKLELLDALRKADAPVLNDDEANTEQKNASANPSAQKNASKPSMMERNSTAHTYEWQDSIDDSVGESSGRGQKGHLPRQKRLVASPLRSKRNLKGARRSKVPWTTVETLAVLKGYESYGPNWMQIKAANPIVLARRTNVDIKDRFRAVKRLEEARH